MSYEHFLYGECRHIPPATLPGMKERTITISGLTKTFSITGWRIGYCICDAFSRVQLRPNIPDGAYYVLADISGLPGKNSKERAMYLLRETGVAWV